MEPIEFIPLYMERVWGGRLLEADFRRDLPKKDTPYGESWELSDREGEQSVVKTGKFKGKTLNQLWLENRDEIFGRGMPNTPRFPLLIKILDAQADLSVQVHPPEEMALELGGEAKTEMWYIADVKGDGKLYVGMKNGVSEEKFKAAITEGAVEECIHTVFPVKGDSIHIESGRLHAIGAGMLIYEIQQNSDTTYRVFDWNRVGLTGVPRQLHVQQSMKCIDFSDVEPKMDVPDGDILSDCPYFKVEKHHAQRGEEVYSKEPTRFSVITVISGTFSYKEKMYSKGKFLLLPANTDTLHVVSDVEYLETTIPI